MDKKRFDFIGKNLASTFAWGRFQEAITILMAADTLNISNEELIAYKYQRIEDGKQSAMEYDKILKEDYEEFSKLMRVCPDCGGPLAIREIKIPVGHKNVHGHKSHWFCIAESCLFEEYSTEEIATELKVYGLKLDENGKLRKIE